MSVGIHSGTIHLFRVGQSHHELLIAGPAATATTQMEHAAGPGQIVVSPSTRATLPPQAVDESGGPGLLLRWRQPKVAPLAPVPLRPVPKEVVARYLPPTLRTHLVERSREPEHRAATIAFLRFSGVDALMAAKGPDAVAEALDELITAVQDAATADEVTFLATDIDEDGGKVVLATGLPSTGADDEGRMVRCLRRIADRGLPLPIQVGVNRGHVFVGEVGMAYRSTFSVMGDTVNTAARLMAAAPPGAVYASAAVLERSHTAFATTALPPLHVKGKAAPLRAVAVGAEVGHQAPSEDGVLPFVGRLAEREALRHHLDEVTAGRGGAVVVEGEAGVGKSRLVAEVLRPYEACADGPGRVTTITVRGESYGVTFPLRALRDTVRDLLGVRRGDPAAMASELLDHLRQVDPGLLPVAPLIAEVAHLEVPSTPEVDELEPRFRPDRQADAFVRLLARCITGPLVVVVDDAHWLDDASTNLLARVSAAAGGADGRPWLVISLRRPAAERPAAERPAAEQPEADADATVITVTSLPDSEASELVWSAPDVHVRPHVVRAIVARAAGNPLFLQELLRHVAQTAPTAGAAALPDTLEAVLGAEIDALPRDARQVLRCAAVLGLSFRTEALELILRPDDIALGAVVEAELRDFIESDGERWRFRQALARDVAYEGLSYRRRRELHRRAGAATERLAQGRVEQVADLLARHYSEAQDVDLAWRYASPRGAAGEGRLRQRGGSHPLRAGPRGRPAAARRHRRREGRDVERAGRRPRAARDVRRGDRRVPAGRGPRAGRPDGGRPAGAAARPSQGAERRLHRGVAGGADGRHAPGLRRHRRVPTVAGPPHRVRGDRPPGPGAAARRVGGGPAGRRRGRDRGRALRAGAGVQRHRLGAHRARSGG